MALPTTTVADNWPATRFGRFSLGKTKCKPDKGVVVYRSKMHVSLKRNFQIMPGSRWLEMLLQHVPDKGEHLVRYYGWYSNRSRGQRRKALLQASANENPHLDGTLERIDPEQSRVAKAAWARLIQKVYAVDPMRCPRCGTPMRIVAVIEEKLVVERILRYLGAWALRPPSQVPPEHDNWPQNGQIPLTYHPLPDIA